MGLERRLTDEEVKEIVGAREKRLRRTGKSETEIKLELDTCWRDYKTYNSVFQLHSKGLNTSQIAKELGLHYNQIWGWMKSGKVPLSLGSGRFSLRKREPLQGSSAEKSFLYGLFSGSQKPHNCGCEFYVSSPEREILEQILEPVSNVFQVKPRILSYPKTQWVVRFESAQGMREFNQATYNNKSIPWGLFEREEDKINYLKGFIIRRGPVRYEVRKERFPFLSMNFTFESNPNLCEEFAVLLFDLGLVPHFKKDKVSVIDYVDLKRIYDSGWCLLKSKQEELGNHLSLFGGPKSLIESLPICDLSNLITDVKEDRLDYESGLEIAENWGIKKGTFYSWIHFDKQPRRVKRYHALKSLGKELFAGLTECSSFVLAEYVVNMYVPERYFVQKEAVRATHFGCLRELKEAGIEPVHFRGDYCFHTSQLLLIKELLSPKIRNYGYEPNTLEKAIELTKRIGGCGAKI
jgi:hypothetical protein